MLEAVEVVTTSGVVLWFRHSGLSSIEEVVNSFISETFLFGTVPNVSGSASENPPFNLGKHTIRYAHVKSLGLIFVAVYRSLLHLSRVDTFLDNIATIFIELYGDEVKKPNTTYVRCKNFDKMFDQQLRDLEAKNASNKAHQEVTKGDFPLEDPTLSGNLGEPPLPPGLSFVLKPAATETTMDNSLTATPPGILETKGLSRRARKRLNQANRGAVSNGDEAPSRKLKKEPKKPPTKGKRKWVDGIPVEDTGHHSSAKLDYSDYVSEAEPGVRSVGQEKVDISQMGSHNDEGRFVLKGLGEEGVGAIRQQANSILKAAAEKKADAKAKEDAEASEQSGLLGLGFSYLTSRIQNVLGGKELTKQALDLAMKSMEDHLLKKNVAREAVVCLCEALRKELAGTKTETFESVDAKIRSSMEEALRKMLTPIGSLDLLREIDAVTQPSATSPSPGRPYVISFVGVNGVGKSTNLAKICFFLLQNKYKVLIVAADTFRSGAVEQLRVHVNKLQDEAVRSGGKVDLFEKGYGKDSAVVARSAVSHAATNGYDVVLIDTAGRRHNDTRLMGSLEKFAKFANPDKILMVGEALVGTDSVAQGRNFNRAFGKNRKLDGYIISKCDTVDDMIGAIVSIVYATNVPVLFVGIGQHYPDIRSFSVKWAVEKLLSPNEE